MASKKISELSGLTNPSLTGVTVIVDGGSTYKTTLINLKNTIVDSVSHSFTGSQSFSGSITLNGNLFMSGSQIINNRIIITGTTKDEDNSPQVYIENVDSGSYAKIGVIDGAFLSLVSPPTGHGSGSIILTTHDVSNLRIGNDNGASLVLKSEGGYGHSFRITGNINSSGSKIQDISPFTNTWSDAIIMGNYYNWNNGLLKIKRPLDVSGSINVNSSITASYFVGDGSQLTNLPLPVITNLATTGSNRFNGNQTITGSLSNGSSSFSIGLGSHAEGSDTYAYGPFSHTEGSATFTSTLYSNILNVNVGNNIIEVYSGSNFQVGHEIAYVYNASGNGNKVWRGTVAGINGNFITASGAPLQNVNSSVFWGLHPDGSTLFNLSSGSNQSGLGMNPVTGSLFAHAEGSFNLASGLNSHVEGRKNAAIGNHSHAEGSNVLSTGVASHAEGIGSISMGYGSHAEGFYTISSGSNSHAEGFNTEAKGDYSHTEGNYTISTASYQHVQGKYNLPVPYESAFIIGNGDVFTRANLVCAYDSQFEITGSLHVSGSINNIGYTVLSNVSSSLNFADDIEAASNGVPLGGLYRSGSFILIRLT